MISTAQRNRLLALERELRRLQEEGRLIEHIMERPMELPYVQGEVERLRERVIGLRNQLRELEDENENLRSDLRRLEKAAAKKKPREREVF